MLSDKHFHLETGYDESELFVTVTHKPTGLQRTERPREGESVRKAWSRLIAEISREFFRLEEFQFSVGRCQVGDRIGDCHLVTHLPSGKSRSADTVTYQGLRHELTQDLIDALVEELWNAGIRPKALLARVRDWKERGE